MPVIKYVYMQNFMFVGVRVIEILEFNSVLYASVRVTLTYTDTLTRGEGEGGNLCTIRVLSELL